MTADPPKPGAARPGPKAMARAAREARLAAALRTNLRKRKAAAQADAKPKPGRP
jgi:hypothetical protein